MELVKILKALGDENRLRIINLLGDEELCVCEIENILEISQSNASRHLTKLGSANLVTFRKKAQWVYYRTNVNTLAEYPFVNELLASELKKISQCKLDTERFAKYKTSGLTCEKLKECKFEGMFVG